MHYLVASTPHLYDCRSTWSASKQNSCLKKITFLVSRHQLAIAYLTPCRSFIEDERLQTTVGLLNAINTVCEATLDKSDHCRIRVCHALNAGLEKCKVD